MCSVNRAPVQADRTFVFLPVHAPLICRQRAQMTVASLPIAYVQQVQHRCVNIRQEIGRHKKCPTSCTELRGD